ncbi:hypothetical protein [Falsiroseomonas sp. HW251]|uniref:hypothetical protein n=1 Tax=Falsiroseomonas sp. HW251 TaxID=3390998 RepID=UPI003D3103EF
MKMETGQVDEASGLMRFSPPGMAGRLRIAVASLVLLLSFPAIAETRREAPLHYAVNLRGEYARAASVGFNLADVSSPSALDLLPEGMKGLLWLRSGFNGRRNECAWRMDDADVRSMVVAVRGHPRFSGIYFIADEPHPSLCPEAPRRIAERSALIRYLHPGARTFIVVLNTSRYPDELAQLRDAADYVGIDPYPCNRKNAARGCDLRAMRERIEGALAAGIAPERLVPVFQAFGQSCSTAAPGYQRLPTEAEMRAMFDLWDELVPPARRPFDMTYSWGAQPRHACPTLAMADGREAPDLLAVFTRYFTLLVGR